MIVDGMDWKTMEQFVYDTIDANLDNYTVEELITEVEDYYPELLQQDEVSVIMATNCRRVHKEKTTCGTGTRLGLCFH